MIEKMLTTCSHMLQAFVHGDSLRDHVVAVIVPDEDVVKMVAKMAGIEGEYKEVCASEKLRAMLVEQMEKAADKASLNSLERVK